MSAASSFRLTALLAAMVVAAACAGGEKETPAPGSNSPAASTTPSVDPTGRVITVEMYTDEKGNYFKPAKFEAHRGDILRFTLMTGVHNVHFVADSNPGKNGLPPVSEFLQIPGQTFDLTVAMAPGHYVFQCDPHAALGMIGRLEVEDEDDKKRERRER
jgi:plastocyanin